MDYLQRAKDNIRKLIVYDKSTGVFTRAHCGLSLGTTNKAGYSVFSLLGKLQYSHRLAWSYMTGDWPSMTIDHINGNRLDNRWSNLRHISKAENCQNRQSSIKDKQMGAPIGVHFDKKKRLWRADITVNYKQKFLGYSRSENDARSLYLNAKNTLHPGYVRG